MTNQPEKYQEFLLYKGPDGKVHFEVYLYNETIWLTQKKMAELFDVNVPAISKHLQNLYSEGELQKKATVSKKEIVQKEGNRNVTRTREFYNLDAIISVGYRVNNLDYAENQARKGIVMYMKDWIIKLDAFLQFNDEEIHKPMAHSTYILMGQAKAMEKLLSLVDELKSILTKGLLARCAHS